ncbi:multiple sugar transport system substrate-binding protein [Paenibacillus anaericanus]|uniref:ABC transporter substrate-binding protein n=1 Tax=Paenibacillus anaericanus TaxID=170367 RepID=UPI00278AAA00|nr:extracellular solute-binding protein [Paenibacillus anaericanus]MDQ0089687.1 multiple sugar transport system substrate-binding protein [Paenibacillus anaericanus]
MKKKWLALIASTVLLTGLLAGCGSSGSNESANDPSNAANTTPTVEDVTIKFINWEPASVYQPAIDAFQTKFPHIKVEYVPLVENDSNETLKKLDMMYASGDDFDVFSLNSIPNYSQRASNGMLEPLDSYISKEGMKYEDEYKAEQMKVDGVRYSLPGKFGPWLILLNKDQLDAAGLSVPKDWTWDEFRDYSKALTSGEGASKHYGTFFHSWKDYFLLRQYSEASNQGIMKDDGLQLNADNPLMKQSLQLRYDMEYTDKSSTPYQDVITQKIPYRDQYFQGKASMLPTGPWMIAEAGGTDKIPATFVSAFAPWPSNNKGDDIYSFGSADSLVISANSKHKQESYEFIRFLSTEGMALTKQLSAWSKADLEKEVDAIIASTQSPDKIDKTSLLNVLNVTKLPNPPNVVSYSADLESAYIAESEKYLLGITDLDTTMNNISTNLQKIIDANKK